MTWYEYDPQLALDADSREIAPAGSTGLVYAATDTDFATPLDITDTGDVPLASLTVGGKGLIPGFRVEDQKIVAWKSGAYVTYLFSFRGVIADAEDAAAAAGAAQAAAEAAQTAAEAAQAAAEAASTGGIVVWDNIQDKPTVFDPDDHTQAAATISDSTPVGRAVLTAADEQAARAAISAAPSTVVSFPGFGTTTATAARGNHTHAATTIPFTPAGAITATNVQDALVQAASTGGTGGTSDTVTVIYASGAYPAQAGSPPSGVKVRHFYGPVQPTAAPWSGVLDLYTVVSSLS